MLGTPVMRGSGSTAIRSARAVALKTASLMWWLLRPWCATTCRLNRPLAATACQKSSTSSLSKSPILAVLNGDLKDQEVAAARDRAAAGDQRLFHRQREVAVAADAGLVAQRLPQGLAQADAHVLDRVMLVDVQVALGTHRQIAGRVLGQQRQHVIEEADAGRDLGLAGAVEVQLQIDRRFRRLAVNRGGAWHAAKAVD